MALKKKLALSQHNTSQQDAYRIIDANINRCKEGLRVCEDIARFHLTSLSMTKNIGSLRHRLTRIIKNSNINKHGLYENRDSNHDCGKKFFYGPERKFFNDVFMANAQRVKEALRVLEEFFKLFDASASKRVQKLRFDFYALEKNIIKKFPALLGAR